MVDEKNIIEEKNTSHKMADEKNMVEEKNTSSSTSATDSSPDGGNSLKEEMLQREVFCECLGGERVSVRASLMFQSQAFDDMWKSLNVNTNELPDDFVFPMTSVPVPVFKKIINWMESHVGQQVPEFEEDPNTRERKWFVQTDFEKDFFKVEVEELVDFLNASNFLNLQSLYRHSCQAMAALLKDRSPEEIRDLLGIEDDLTEEQKAEIRRKNVWCNY
ncbi:hypothetical protein niasHS_010614 [Heterodera schachtii]|uniref:SKP1 component dimerisation domain-containing protein n=2 Tax=Heterodera TaxID=34509 RepID=A0ABD2IUL2_HETSC